MDVYTYENQASCCCAGGQPAVKTGCPKLDLGRDLTWTDLVNIYPDPKECLASFVVSSAAEVLAGIKPGNMIRVLARTLPCGFSMQGLWQQHGEQVLAGSALQALTLREDQDGSLLLLYRADLLEKRLQSRTMQTFLQQRGYPGDLTLEKSLACLQQAFLDGAAADEVGFFLGYPAKDIKGFINGRSNPWDGRCLWRIYGPPQRSLKLYQSFCAERRRTTEQLAAGISPLSFLRAA